MAFVNATKEQTFLKAALAGPSGSGKTFSALRMAKGIVAETGGTIGFIDTERRSARKYSDLFDFLVNDLKDTSPEAMMQAIDDAEAAGIEVLIIDSISHAWKSLLAHIDKIAAAKYRSNSFRAWSEGTPIQEDFINKILDYPGHIFCCMRAKTEYVQEKDDNNKTQIRKVGMAPIQGKDIEYEFDILFDLNRDHSAIVNKSHVSTYDEKGAISKLTEEDGVALWKWATSGEKRAYRGTKAELMEIGKKYKVDAKEIKNILDPLGGFDNADWEDMIAAVKKFGEEKAVAAKKEAEKKAAEDKKAEEARERAKVSPELKERSEALARKVEAENEKVNGKQPA